MNLILIGLRGSGKTIVGRLAAERLGRAFVDLDDVVPRLLGCNTPAEAWRMHGEPAFRLAETRALREVLRQDGRALALGGGTPTAPGAAELIRGERAGRRAMVVYLAAEAETLRVRLEATDLSTRPSLTGADPHLEIDAVLSRRDPLFRELADSVIETDGMTVEEIADQVAAELNSI